MFLDFSLFVLRLRGLRFDDHMWIQIGPTCLRFFEYSFRSGRRFAGRVFRVFLAFFIETKQLKLKKKYILSVTRFQKKRFWLLKKKKLLVKISDQTL